MGRAQGIRRTALAGVALLCALTTAALLAACGGGGGGAGGAEDVVTEWVEGWQKASGVRRDDFAAGQMRGLLTGELRERVSGQTPRIFSELMALPFPPDEGHEILSSEAEEDSAIVVVQLIYSDAAAGSAAANGLIAFEDVQRVHDEVAGDPSRTIHLVKVEDAWKIESITE